MPWIEARLRGQKVLARARDDGTLDARGGRVEIRYRPNDGRAYQAAARNLDVASGASLLPDDHCAPADAAPPPAASSADGKSGGKAKAGASAAPKPVERVAGGWQVYTDGACSGNPGPAGAGLVVIGPDGKIREGYRWLGTATNNIAELTAIQLALEALPADAPGAVIFTDSQYAIGILTKGWRPKANQDLVAKIRETLAPWGRRVRFSYVPGHSGVPMNERADELAREAIRTGQSRAAS